MTKKTLCDYSSIFGLPNQGVHKYRFLNLAIVDLASTLIVAILISIYNEFDILEFLGLFFLFILLGIVMHKIFCVKTKLNSLLFG